ncbi:unnamed protein product [Durusdinium trenchii]|uniref:Uncharacterized protein n=1 Tax=Durusdinium trenchii TaxID=1381693 RepID=A0ABP0RB25_9DINO
MSAADGSGKPTAECEEEEELPFSSTVSPVPKEETAVEAPRLTTDEVSIEDAITLTQDEPPAEDQMEVGTPTSFLERADKMVTWEEDCAPGLALAATATTAGTDSESRESPKEVENDGSSVATWQHSRFAEPRDGGAL